MEILNDLIEKQEKLEKQFGIIEDLLRKNLSRPPAPVKVDTQAISQELKVYLGDPSLKVTEAELKISQAVNQIPSVIRVQGDFFGFSSRKSSVIFLSIFGICCGLLGGFCYYEKTQADYQRRLAESFEEDYQKVARENPKLAERYKAAVVK